MGLLFTDYFALILIICIGFIIGNIKIKGISLDISAIIFVALLFGYWGVSLPSIIEQFGLVLFIYTIGIQSGPGFFDSFKTQGRKLIVLAIVVVLSGSVLTLASILIFDIEMPVAIGLLSGALTSTPGLAAGIESTQSPSVPIGYGVAYPFGVIGVILFVKIFPRILKINLKKAEEDFKHKSTAAYDEIISKNFIIDNDHVEGKSLAELKLRTITQAVISRIMHEGEAITPMRDTLLHKGDYVKAVGTKEALKKLELLIGTPADIDIPLDHRYEVRSVLVTNKVVVNKHIAEFNLLGNYNASITRVRRSGIDFTPNGDLKLQLGDKLMVAASKESMALVLNLFGNDDKKLSDTDFFPVAAGIVLGILIGKLSISFGTSFSFSLGLTGGILVVSMVLSRIGKTGNIIWTMSGSANQLLRQLGLMFFLASVGTQAGATLSETFSQYGYKLFVIGGVITLVPMILAVIVDRLFLKLNILSMLGALTGSMTSTPGLAAMDSSTDTNAPSVAYATVYPIAMVLLIICIQLLSYVNG